MNAKNRRIAGYRLMGLGIIIFALFGMAIGIMLIQSQQRMAIRAQIIRNR